MAAGAQVLRRARWHRPLVAMVEAGTVFQVLTLVQPPVRVGLVLVSSLAALLGWPEAAGHSTRAIHGQPSTDTNLI